jgi:DinB superfamily
MVLPSEIETFWGKLQAARQEVLKEVEGLSQAQLDWRPAQQEWSIGEVIHHLTLGEISTGKLTTKLLREAEEAGTLSSRPEGQTFFDRLPPPPSPLPTGAAQTPPHIWPEHGRSKPDLLAGIRAARVKSRQSFERVATIDPRPLVWRHATVGDLHLGQYWTLMLIHDGIHIEQIRKVKAEPAFSTS